jgi:hypothetical protein
VTKTADNAISFLRFMSLSFRDLPVQIPTSVALNWVSGWDSPATNPDRDQNHLVAFTVSPSVTGTLK